MRRGELAGLKWSKVDLDAGVVTSTGGEPWRAVPSRAWQLLAGLDDAALDRLRMARSQARTIAWAQAAETGRTVVSSVAGL